MRWEARSNQRELGVGARLCIYGTPQIAGQPAPTLIGDQEVHIDVAGRSWIAAEIRGAKADAAILVLPNGEQYQMSPRRQEELGSSFHMRSMHSQDWIVRSQVVPTAK